MYQSLWGTVVQQYMTDILVPVSVRHGPVKLNCMSAKPYFHARCVYAGATVGSTVTMADVGALALIHSQYLATSGTTTLVTWWKWSSAAYRILDDSLSLHNIVLIPMLVNPAHPNVWIKN